MFPNTYNSTKNAKIFAAKAAVIDRFLNFKDIIVRLAFVLGNITGKETETRKELYFKHSSLGVFLSVLHEYFNVSSSTYKSMIPMLKDLISSSHVYRKYFCSAVKNLVCMSHLITMQNSPN